jgi:hypothetical protein
MLERLFIISKITYQQTVRQPMYYIVLLVSIGLLFLAAPFALFSFGKELNMLREVGLATITMANIIIAVLGADFVIASEMEKQTALITLTKPVRRSEFIIGKFLGLIFAIFLATLLLTITFLLIYWLKEGSGLIKENLFAGRYLQKGASLIWKDTLGFFQAESWLFIKGSYAYYLQVTVVTALAVLLSVFFSLPIMAGGVVTFFVIANISPYLYSGIVTKGFSVLNIMAEIIYTVIPNFTNFNVSSQVATVSSVSLFYLGLITLYALIWDAIILAFTVVLFQRYEIK